MIQTRPTSSVPIAQMRPTVLFWPMNGDTMAEERLDEAASQ